MGAGAHLSGCHTLGSTLGSTGLDENSFSCISDLVDPEARESRVSRERVTKHDSFVLPQFLDAVSTGLILGPKH